MRTLLPVLVVALMLAAGCAHGAGWDRSDRSRMPFDGEDPSMVRVVTDTEAGAVVLLRELNYIL